MCLKDACMHVCLTQKYNRKSNNNDRCTPIFLATLRCMLSAAHVILHLKKNPASPALVVVVVGAIGGLELAGGVRGLTGKKDYTRYLGDTSGREPILSCTPLLGQTKSSKSN